MKARLFLTSTLFLFAQMPTMQAQETVEVACPAASLRPGLPNSSRTTTRLCSGDTLYSVSFVGTAKPLAKPQLLTV